jgi:glycosyltransferase involved in cell wall biosynthesis
MEDYNLKEIQIRIDNNDSILDVFFILIKNKKKIYFLLLILFLHKSVEILVKRYISSPKISIFLPIYNKAHYLNRSISSIQIQTLKDIEIIPVNDGSEDNTLEILKKMAKNDTRIKIVNNNKNRGLLYSRAMGIINSNGKYLMNLDPDDQLEGPDNLEFLYNKANQAKVNVISFGFLMENNFELIKLIKCNNFDKVLYQPNIYINGNQLSDYLITNKLVRRSLLLKAYKKFKKKIYEEKWNYAEDEVWSTLVNKYANSMICVDKIIFIYYSNNDSLMKNRFNSLYFSNIINWLEMFMKIFTNKKTEKYLQNRISYIIYLFKNSTNTLMTIKNNTQLKNKYIYILKKIVTFYNLLTGPLNDIIDSLK